MNPYSCFACTLAECDLKHRDCRLLMAERERSYRVGHGLDVPADIRAGANEWFRQWKIEWLARRSEAA